MLKDREYYSIFRVLCKFENSTQVYIGVENSDGKYLVFLCSFLSSKVARSRDELLSNIMHKYDSIDMALQCEFANRQWSQTKIGAIRDFDEKGV